jgi:hypothetical protein
VVSGPNGMHIVSIYQASSSTSFEIALMAAMHCINTTGAFCVEGITNDNGTNIKVTDTPYKTTNLNVRVIKATI